MSSIFSKPAQNNLTLETDQPCTSFEPNVHACDQFDADLIDKIKLAIAKLKATTKEHCPHKKDLQSFLVLYVTKNGIKIRMLFIVPAVFSGFIESAIAHLKMNIRNCQMNLMMSTFIACYVS